MTRAQGESNAALTRRLGTVCLHLAACLLVANALAHEFTITPATLVVRGDGSFQIDLGLDADALAAGLPLEAPAEDVARAIREIPRERFSEAVDSARAAVREDIRVLFDRRPAAFEVSFPHHGTSAATAADPPTVLGTLARLTGRVPSDARQVAFRAAERYKTVSFQLVLPSRSDPLSAVMRPGEASPEFRLDGDERAHPPGVVVSYLRLGFTHILPKGLDHILFVIGLFLLGAGWRPLLYQVTAFTLAHSVTLALSMQGIVALPERFVETLIALSISWVAIENIATSKLMPWRVAIVFGFGLLHGLGFAGVLGELGMPEGRFFAALLAFNLGVELGQLSVLAIAFALAGRFQHLEGYRRYVIVPCSAVIAATGGWWAVTRALG